MKICFNENLPFRSKKDTFLTNADNKQNFIKLLCEHLSGIGCNVSNADGDADLADLKIVKTAVQLSDETPTTVISEDTYLLVLLCHHANMNKYNIISNQTLD